MSFYILLCVIWCVTAVSIANNLIPYTNELCFWKKMVVGIVILVGAPFLLAAELIEILLDYFLEEGWNDDDEDKFGY